MLMIFNIYIILRVIRISIWNVNVLSLVIRV